MMDLIGANMKDQIQTCLSSLINVEFDNHDIPLRLAI